MSINEAKLPGAEFHIVPWGNDRGVQQYALQLRITGSWYPIVTVDTGPNKEHLELSASIFAHTIAQAARTLIVAQSDERLKEADPS